MTSRDGRPRPALFAVLIVVGLLLIGLSWVDASGELRYENQLTALNVGIVGEIVVLASCAVYLVLYRRTVRNRVQRVHGADVEALG
ncbi:hypothetical protein GCM10009547_00110 [Sporichthya brevicatena]|uniref:Uncharacterized protein n=1 Tax=Sporichthya brevicatena TaxID=171442 RepID=A0ABN1G248_9ACTN